MNPSTDELIKGCSLIAKLYNVKEDAYKEFECGDFYEEKVVLCNYCKKHLQGRLDVLGDFQDEKAFLPYKVSSEISKIKAVLDE